VIPQIAGARAAACVQSTMGMEAAAMRVTHEKPDLVVLVSPHTPRLEQAFGMVRGPLRGDFSKFGAQELSVMQPTPSRLGQNICQAVQDHGLSIEWIEIDDLDHGASVPLYFLEKAGWKGQTLLLALPWKRPVEECVELGKIVSQYLKREGVRWSFVASGDMSHCLMEGAPAGFHPDGSRFDALFKDWLQKGDFKSAIFQTRSVRKRAAEDVVESVAVAYGTFQHRIMDTHSLPPESGPKIFSYEGPFGVGYLNALLFENYEQHFKTDADAV